MGTQKGIIPLTGRVGTITFYKRKDGYAARTASGMDGKKIKTHPRYQRTRENLEEFKAASIATKIFRAAFVKDVKAVGDGTLTNRVRSLMYKLVLQDTVNLRGARKVLPGNLHALERFEFNTTLPLTQDLKIVPVIDRQAGTASVEVPAFSPMKMFAPPLGATHLVLKAAAAEIDLEGQRYQSVSTESEPIALGDLQSERFVLQNSIPTGTRPLILAFGISFVQVLKGVNYALQSGLYNMMQVVKVDTGIAVV
jgi:hypothetical protein